MIPRWWIRLCYVKSKFLLWLIFRLGFGLQVCGQEHIPRRGGFILAANHVSFLDPPVLGVACPRRVVFMARSSLFRGFWLGTYLRSVGVIPIVREESDVGAVREGLRRLRGGDALAMFPEGGRQASGQLANAKRGVGLLATTARVPIVPALIRGTFDAWPRGATYPRRSKIQVAFGEPIPYTKSPSSPATRHHHQALADEVTRRWRRLLDQLNG